jgi:biopolymer transport protein ExbD
MKPFKLLVLIAFLFTATVFSQVTPAISPESTQQTIQPEPLFVIKLSNGEVYVQQPLLEKLDPNWVESITVIKNLESDEIKQYGKRAENGLVLVFIKKENEEEVKKILPQ